MKRLGFLATLWLLLLIEGCTPSGSQTAEPSADRISAPPSDSVSDRIETVEEMNAMSPGLIIDVYTDKSRYAPEESPVLTVELSGGSVTQLDMEVRVRHKLENVFTTRETITVPTAGTIQDVALSIPGDDFTGYSVEVFCYYGETLLDFTMTAVDVSSDWNVFPRYGYLTKMIERSREESRAVLDRLRKHHITGLFYYDVIDAHDKPLAGTAQQPASSWNTLNHASALKQTVEDMIRIGHEYNMNSFIYNLIFGAYDGYQQHGISEEWGLYKDKNHGQQDNHDLSSLGWESEKLWLFDPGNIHWQDYYLGVHADLFAAYDFDGIQVDSLGSRGTLYDYQGNSLSLNERYNPLLSRLASELDARVLFNAVSGYGLSEQLAADYYDMIYMEIWPSDGSSYTKLKTEIDRIYRSTQGEKGTVIAAYMNYQKKSGAFNRPGIILTNAVMLAAGGSHMELGDTGMLKSEYYPGESLRINEALADDLRRYYSFMTAYENLLRGPGLSEIAHRTYIDGNLTAPVAEKDRVWSFAKQKEDGTEIYHLINLTGVAHTEWADEKGTQTEPEILANQRIRIYLDRLPQTVALASPDWQRGVMADVPFISGSDNRGQYIEFILPSLEYWSMIVVQ